MIRANPVIGNHTRKKRSKAIKCQIVKLPMFENVIENVGITHQNNIVNQPMTQTRHGSSANTNLYQCIYPSLLASYPL